MFSGAAISNSHFQVEVSVLWSLSIGLHIVGFLLWGGGLMFLTRMLIPFVKGESGSPGLIAALRRSYIGFVLVGCALTIFTGMFQLISRGLPFYFAQGWFHGKLTLVVVLLIATVVAHAQLAKLERGALLSKVQVIAVHAIVASTVVATILLTILGRG